MRRERSEKTDGSRKDNRGGSRNAAHVLRRLGFGSLHKGWAEVTTSDLANLHVKTAHSQTGATPELCDLLDLRFQQTGGCSIIAFYLYQSKLLENYEAVIYKDPK